MFVCLECGELFATPEHFVETHGLDSPPYEEWNGSPCCAADYAEVHECDCCGRNITEDYIKTRDGCRYCQDCFKFMELGEEDSG